MNGYGVLPIPAREGKNFLRRYHYTGSVHNGPMCYGLFDGDLVGVIAFSSPISEAARGAIFGPEHANRVIDLHRMVLLDDLPTNTESWFIVRALKMLKIDRSHLWAVTTFADSTQGHVGTIYQATNALYIGTSSPARFYRDGEGRLRAPRQNGKNISLEEAAEMGWTAEMRGAKHRYVYLLPDDRSHRRILRRLLIPTPREYPKAVAGAVVT